MHDINDHYSVEKQEVQRAKVGEITRYSNSKFTLKDLKAELAKLEKKAKKEGYKDIEVDFEHDYGGENSLGGSYMVVVGTRLETDDEWHRRLDRIKREHKMEIENAERTLKAVKIYTDKIAEVEKALEKSPLKCENCGSPESGLTHKGNWKRSRRICPKCCDKV